MRDQNTRRRNKSFLLRLAYALAALLVAIVGWALASPAGAGLQGMVWLPVVAVALLIILMGELAARFAAVAQKKQDALIILEQSHQSVQQRLDGLQRINRTLVDAPEEKDLVQAALEVISEIVGAEACSFTPLDEWGQAFTAFTHGNLPGPDLEAWAEHLASPEVHEKCKACQALEAASGRSSCPLQSGRFSSSYELYCLPLRREERLLGMLNLFLPPERPLTAENRQFLEDLLGEVGLAVQAVRLRNQELTTLRQLQWMHSAKVDLPALLGGLLESLRQALEVDWVMMRVNPLDEGESGLWLQKGGITPIDQEQIAKVCEEALRSGQPLSVWTGKTALEGFRMVQALPLRASQDRALGVLIIASEREQLFNHWQNALLHTMSSQASLLIENERMMLSLEYHMIMKERTRLAREIHDGLAQTLAFLKMQAAQMQHYLDRGENDRLRQAIIRSHQALSEAYLDTRQAIENLRLAPQEGLLSWIEQLAADFEMMDGAIEVRSSLDSPEQALTPEVQAQLIRIMQEALSNIRKHANAKQVFISLRSWEGDLILEVSDDGEGFSPEDIPLFSQHGLRGMRERAELIGADFQIISGVRRGTIVRLRLPGVQEAMA